MWFGCVSVVTVYPKPRSMVSHIAIEFSNTKCMDGCLKLKITILDFPERL